MTRGTVPVPIKGSSNAACGRQARIADCLAALEDEGSGQSVDLAGGLPPRPLSYGKSMSPSSITGGSFLGSSYRREEGSAMPGRGKAMSPSEMGRFVSAGVSPYGASRDDVLPRPSPVLSSNTIRSNFLTEKHIRSLGDASGSALASSRDMSATPVFSPTLEALKEVRSNSRVSRRLKAATLEAQELRRGLLREACIVVVTTGSTSKRFIYERMNELGVRTFIMDGPDSWSRILQEDGVIERFLPVDMSVPDRVFGLCVDTIQALVENEGVDIDAICTFCEIAVPLTSRLCEAFSLPCNPSSAVDAARDKHATRLAIKRAGLPSVQSIMLPSPEKLMNLPEDGKYKSFIMNMTSADLKHDVLARFGGEIGYPLVMKPVSGAASIGVLKVENDASLEQAFIKVMRDMIHSHVQNGALILDQSDDVEDGGTIEWPSIMLEEYLDGEEVDIDVILTDGECVYHAVSDNWPCEEPWFNETGDNAPSVLGDETEHALQSLAVESCRALGLTTGVFHVECKATSRGPRLIEVNCRMGGGPVRDINLRVNGIDLVEEQLFASAGIPCNPPYRLTNDSDATRIPAHERPPLSCVAGYTVNAPKTGLVKEGAIDAIMRWASISYVESAEVFVKPGDRVVCKHDGLPTWMGEVRLHASTPMEAKERAEKMRDELLAAVVKEIE